MSIFLSRVPKNFVGEPLCVPQKFLYRKKIMHKREPGREGVREGGREGGDFAIFGQEFLSHCA